jgi:hyaluronoglucosaminidase
MSVAPGFLGVIEGYFGKPWSWDDRTAVMRALKPHGYDFFWYAPKADSYLRKRWKELHPAKEREAIAAFAAACKAEGVRFGVGLSPYEAWTDFGRETRASLKAKLADLNAMGVEDLAILFDDMKGDVLDLAAKQVVIAHQAAEWTKAKRLILCPSYYTDDPILDRVFGARPANYLEDLGLYLDPEIALFWTGPKVCSKAYPADHLQAVAGKLGRKPFLWDNYPVNDGPRMSPFLHLASMTGRPASNADLLAGHAVNPALQPHLSLLPLVSLAKSYGEGGTYDPQADFARGAAKLGEGLSACLLRDAELFQTGGLKAIGEDAAKLKTDYARFDHPAAREICRWLDGQYAFGAEELQTQ